MCQILDLFVVITHNLEQVNKLLYARSCINNFFLITGRCVDEIGTHSCSCDEGYSGKTCDTIINPCKNNPCGTYGYCCWHGDSVCSKELAPLEVECYCYGGYTGIVYYFVTWIKACMRFVKKYKEYK